MQILPVDSTNLSQFLAYCEAHGREIDESYLGAEDLAPEAFHPGTEEPTYLLLSTQGEPVGAASLMIKEYRSKQTARLRIFHTLGHLPQGYRLLLAALLPHCAGLETIHLFVPEDLQPIRRAFEQVGFTIQRYSWILQRPAMALADAAFPPGFHLRPFVAGRDAQAWCRVRNTAFMTLLGQNELTPEQVERRVTHSDYIPDGMLILYDGDQAVGTVQAAEDFDLAGVPSTWIYTLAILPEYQHRGLGRRLLRAAIAVGVARGLPSTCLVVNAENDSAAALYFNEGFHKVQAVVCYQYVI